MLDKLQELIRDLEKHQSEIINYSRRNQAGKTIGSGRVDKAVNLTVGSRQKNKGMSWRPVGSKALCLLKVVELNGQWQQLWFPTQATRSMDILQLEIKWGRQLYNISLFLLF
ncbi:hypothetical protein C7B80_19215 [Cyanosarcina cf. burmensis CCALA 770]|nr:hypothetical protein C7B80_19215 [Cyanosarcina cf. burmensis CCALA 770]